MVMITFIKVKIENNCKQIYSNYNKNSNNERNDDDNNNSNNIYKDLEPEQKQKQLS